ncbi:adenylate cyclase [Rothia sp. HMSC071C12]|uniref:adenylate cyclase n=1 Tax=Rothia TaxID=32207 RepID=UPI0008A5E6FE|nr:MULTISPECIES: adenylate cyclase [Rothia]OFQ35530.1 adenylate cyclase [Rothia sp. HMSC071C12]
MAKKPFTPLALIGIACCLGVSSCSTTVEVKQDIRNVLASYENPSPDINVALVNEVKKCMSEKSFTYSGSQNIISGASVLELAMSDAYLPSEEAATRGYLFTRQDNASSSNEPAMENPAYRKAFQGDPQAADSKTVTITLSNGAQVGMATDSCLGRAAEAVFGSTENYLKYTNFINELTTGGSKNNAVEEMGKYYRNDTTYGACMKESGYADIQHFGDAPSYAEKTWGKYKAANVAANAEEQSLAHADYNCQKSTGILTKAQNIYYEKAATWLNEHEPLILEVRDIERQAQERAAALLNGN